MSKRGETKHICEDIDHPGKLVIRTDGEELTEIEVWNERGTKMQPIAGSDLIDSLEKAGFKVEKKY